MACDGQCASYTQASLEFSGHRGEGPKIDLPASPTLLYGAAIRNCLAMALCLRVLNPGWCLLTVFIALGRMPWMGQHLPSPLAEKQPHLAEGLCCGQHM
jgi:hypothetical protein